MTTHTITWKGYELKVTGTTDGHDAEIDSIEGMDVVDLLLTCDANSCNEITEAFAQAEQEARNDYHGDDTLWERDN
jgi:hypothetical protein